MQDADLDGVVRSKGRGQRKAEGNPSGRRQPATAGHRRYVVSNFCKHRGILSLTQA